MELITKRYKIDVVADRWKHQYYDISRGWTQTLRGSTENVYRRLKELPQGATEEQVAGIIGNRSWTKLQCDECGKAVSAVVQVGAPPDYESSTAWLCLDCLHQAVKLAKAEG
jgi:hypothetical protein